MTRTPGVAVAAALPKDRLPLMLISLAVERASLRTLPATSSLSMKINFLPHKVCGFLARNNVVCWIFSCPSPVSVCQMRGEEGTAGVCTDRWICWHDRSGDGAPNIWSPDIATQNGGCWGSKYLAQNI